MQEVRCKGCNKRLLDIEIDKGLIEKAIKIASGDDYIEVPYEDLPMSAKIALESAAKYIIKCPRCRAMNTIIKESVKNGKCSKNSRV